jgi:macrolide transport system ATP-binding/permease protein
MDSISPKAEIGYFTQTGYKFNTHKSVLSFMQEECEYTVAEIRAVLASMGIGANDIQKLIRLIGGEIIKLLLSKMLLGKYNILLMDEPGNYLDLKSIAALETMMKSYAGTIIFVSHDKQLVDNIADIIYEIKDHKIIKTFERDC